ncbi:hypothetical protein [Schleiferia thermophila]|uniref:Uncharacterized protein n=2 Tax=Schleiferia thermophila TaxID=884107 RepID=A0A369A3Y3_9FLAO|nr:hypothetical protein [Schleiferia thermophila]KFD38224.1 hypothetical protein AT05_11115 [Schleiferia thermophila str. Yellowstone]RCX02164.1 hypothetical protein DES35_105136 [Schleiferia thermophila]
MNNMEKSIKYLYIIGLLCFNSIYAQQKLPLEKRISDDICKCFGEYGFAIMNEQVSASLDTCSNTTVKKYQADLELYFSSRKDAGYDKGYEAGRLYFQQKVVPLLFTECDAIKKLQIKRE